MALSRSASATGRDYRAPVLRLNAIDWIALVLLILGGIHWGLIGVLNLDLVAAILGTLTLASRVVYGLVGLAALYGIVLATKFARIA